MLILAKKNVALSVMALLMSVILLPLVSFAAISPAVTVLSPLAKGLRSPVKIALDAEGHVYVADQRVGGIVKYDTYGAQLSTIRTAAAPSGLAFAQDGTLLVSQASSVVRYNVSTGQEIGGLSGWQLQQPAGIAVDDVTGYVYVVDTIANQVVVYTASGDYAKVFGNGTLFAPTGITFEKVSRQLVVADTLNSRVCFFSTVDDSLQKIIGLALPPTNSLYGSPTAPFSPMQFDTPVAIAFEYSKDPTPVLNRTYIVDSFQGRVQVVDSAANTALYINGQTNNFIGTIGVANGELMVPSDAVFDAVNSRLMVVNGYGNVTIYGIDGGTNPVDVTAPVFTVNPVPVEVAVNTLTISGTVEADSSIQVVAADSAKVGTVAYTGSTLWSVDVSALNIGNNVFNIKAIDRAGNVATLAVSVNYQPIQPPPIVVIGTLPALTGTAKITIPGTVDAGATVVVLNQSTTESCNAVVTGTVWSCDLNLAEGPNNLSVAAKIANSTTSVATTSVTLDTTPPMLSLSALSSGSYTSVPVQNFSGTVADLNGASLMINGQVIPLTDNAFSVPVTLLNGTNVVTVVAQDSVGNATTDSRIIEYDSAKPVIGVTEPVDNSFVSTPELTLFGTVDKESTVTVAGTPATVDPKNWSVTVALVPGANTVEIVATDLYGNSSTVKRTITLDEVKPVLAITSPAQDISVNVPNVLISGAVSDSTTVALEYTLNGSATAVQVASGVYSFNVDFTAEGNYPVSVTVKDAAGNSSTVVRNVIYDITPPLFSLDKVSGVMPSSLNGSVEPGSSVVVKDGATEIGSVRISEGLWSADLSRVNYSPGDLLVVATDPAGNSTSKTLVYSFPDGALNAVGKPMVSDALRAIRLAVNQSMPTSEELAHYDIGPLVNGQPNPNGKIEIIDAILILRKALGLKSW